MGSLRLSKKHGVNPSVGICFWCGEGKEVILFGAQKGDKEAPREVVMDYEPCDKCEKGMALGVTFIEAQGHPPKEGMPPIQKEPENVYPTGRWFVVTEEFVRRVFDAGCIDQILSKGKAYVDPQTVELLGLTGVEPLHKI